jgi:hypothetical protein
MLHKAIAMFLTSSILLASCGGAPQSSRLMVPPITKAEAHADVDALVAKVNALYGPLEFKEQRFGFKLGDLVANLKSEVDAAPTESEVFGSMTRFLMSFRDGHVGISFPGNSTDVRSYKLGIFLAPVEGRALVAKVDPSAASLGVAVGDELLSIDDSKPFDLLEIIKKYDAFGNDVSDQHGIFLLTNRRFYMTELLPTKPTAKLALGRADGSTYEVQAIWEKSKEATAKFEMVGPSNASTQFLYSGYASIREAGSGSLMEMGAYKPYFVSEAVKAKFGLVEVEANDDYLKKYGVTRENLQDAAGKAIYSALYKFNGKTVLMIRQPGYYPETLNAKDLVNGYRAVLDQYDDVADVLVIDQNHNPGGSMDYVLEFFSLFTNKPALNLVQKMNADRAWVFGLASWADEVEKEDPGFAKALRLRSALVDKAMDDGKSISDPMPLLGYEFVQPDSKYTWKKPVLVLADELAGSCGDIFPMYMKRNGIAKIFGERTMGLGGNVEEVIQLPYSQASVRLTRGLFTTYSPESNYAESELVENNGITPDIAHKPTVDDFRAGFVEYFEKFSTEVTK